MYDRSQNHCPRAGVPEYLCFLRKRGYIIIANISAQSVRRKLIHRVDLMDVQHKAPAEASRLLVIFRLLEVRLKPFSSTCLNGVGSHRVFRSASQDLNRHIYVGRKIPGRSFRHHVCRGVRGVIRVIILIVVHVDLHLISCQSPGSIHCPFVNNSLNPIVEWIFRCNIRDLPGLRATA